MAAIPFGSLKSSLKMALLVRFSLNLSTDLKQKMRSKGIKFCFFEALGLILPNVCLLVVLFQSFISIGQSDSGSLDFSFYKPCN